MKRFLLIFLVIAVSQAHAQEGQVFKPRYLPGHVYKAANHVEFKALASIEGNQEVIDKLKASGFTQLLNFNFTSDIIGNVTTGPPNDDKTFKVKASYKFVDPRVTIGGKPFPPPTDMFNKEVWLVGRDNAAGLYIKTDSISGEKKDTVGVYVSEIFLNPAIKTLKFPDRKFMPGDTIVQKVDFEAPLDSKDEVSIHVPVIYKLVSIVDGKARFEATSTVDVKIISGGVALQITGSGLGELIYDMKQQFPTSKDMKFDLKLDVTAKDLRVNGTATMTSAYRATIN